MVKLDEFIAAVRSCVGTPVRHRGRRIGVGLDCVGVPVAAMAACGVVIDTPLYSIAPSEGDLVSVLEHVARRTEYPSIGDILALDWKGEARHVAVMVSPTTAVFARVRRRVSVVAEEEITRAVHVRSSWRLNALEDN